MSAVLIIDLFVHSMKRRIKDRMSLFKFFYKVFLIRMMNKGLDLLFALSSENVRKKSVNSSRFLIRIIYLIKIFTLHN